MLFDEEEFDVIIVVLVVVVLGDEGDGELLGSAPMASFWSALRFSALRA